VVYHVYFRLAGDSVWLRANWWVNGTSFLAGFLPYDGEVYEFRVTAANEAGESASPNIATALVEYVYWFDTLPGNDRNGSNWLASNLISGKLCRFGRGQIVCFNSRNTITGQPLTLGDYLLFPGSSGAFNDKLLCEGYKRADIRWGYGRAAADQYGPDILRHEAIHSGQWAGYRTATEFGLAYAAASAYARRPGPQRHPGLVVGRPCRGAGDHGRRCAPRYRGMARGSIATTERRRSRRWWSRLGSRPRRHRNSPTTMAANTSREPLVQDQGDRERGEQAERGQRGQEPGDRKQRDGYAGGDGLRRRGGPDGEAQEAASGHVCPVWVGRDAHARDETAYDVGIADDDGAGSYERGQVVVAEGGD
jgi:hypothetical protein